MDLDSQLKVQAFLDGELPEAESRDAANWLARDQEAASLLAELRGTRKLLAGFDSNMRLPESREFFWSKVERQILREEPARQPQTQQSSISTWLRFLIPAGAAAICILTAVFAAVQFGVLGHSASPERETALADAGTFTYRDDDAGATLVWLPYAASNDDSDDDQDVMVN